MKLWKGEMSEDWCLISANRHSGSGKGAKEMHKKPLATDVLEQSPIQVPTRQKCFLIFTVDQVA
jgi:hypothetical protein